jgi:hypothetical protein
VSVEAGGWGEYSEVTVQRPIVQRGHSGQQAAHKGVLRTDAARLGRQQGILAL